MRFFSALNALTIAFLVSVAMTNTGFAASSAPKEPEAYDKKDDAHSSGEVAGEEDAAVIKTRATSSYEKLPQGRHQPWRLVRSLQRLQDDIALGSAQSLEAYRILHVRAANWMLALDDTVWNHERNLDALAVYTLLGGNTQIGYKALQKSSLEDWQKLPLKAAVAFAERDYASASDFMKDIDHRALPVSIGAQFALSKSMLASSTDLPLAAKLLGEARRMAPGTLVEEAALRRAIRIAGEMGDAVAFRRFSSTYNNRFGKSEYFEDFLRNYSYALVRMPKEHEASMLEELQQLAEVLNPAQKVSVLSYIARHAVGNARLSMANWASTQALQSLKPGSKLYTRMQLYASASGLVFKEHMKEAMKQLQSVEEGKLTGDDKKFYIAVTALAKRIVRKPGEVPNAVTMPGKEPVAQTPADNPPKPANTVLARADSLFAELDKMKKEVDQ